MEPKNVSFVYLCTMLTEQQQGWINRVAELFLRFGIKALTMDDVARELGISKKTLYQFVSSKDDLVNRMVESHIQMERRRSEMIAQTATDALDEMMLVIREMMLDMQTMKANFIFDLQKYHRTAWDQVKMYQQDYMYKLVADNLRRGVQDGLYRDDFDVDVVARLHLGQVFAIFDESWFPKPPYTLEVLFNECMIGYLYSIVSESGRKAMVEKLQELY